MRDVVVVGGGVIGCAISRELALNRVEVTLVERQRPGSNASWAAAGMLSPQAEAEQPGPFLDLLLASRQLYPALAEALREETAVDVGYRDEGTLLIALNEEDEDTLRRRFEWQTARGLSVEWLDRDAMLAREPALNPEARAALRFADDHQVDNRKLAPALWSAAERAGVKMRLGANACRVVRNSAVVAGVELADGEMLRAGTVIIAAGAWAADLQGLPRPLPVHPVHGQLLSLRSARPPTCHVVDSPRAYLVPRADGRVIVGATVEEIGFRQEVTAGGLHSLLAAALEIVPSLAEAQLLETWSGHRPGTPDTLPILGPDPDVPSIVYATGHYRNGILLAPVTAQIAADYILGRPPRHVLDPFSAARFDVS